MFDPVVGRFLEEDPTGFAAGDPDLFRYTANSPTNATDPSGLTLYFNRSQLDQWQRFANDHPGIELKDIGGGYYQVVVGAPARTSAYHSAVADFLGAQFGYSAEARGAALYAMYNGWVSAPHPNYSRDSDKVLGNVGGFGRSAAADNYQLAIDVSMLTGASLTFDDQQGAFVFTTLDPKTGHLVPTGGRLTIQEAAKHRDAFAGHKIGTPLREAETRKREEEARAQQLFAGLREADLQYQAEVLAAYLRAHAAVPVQKPGAFTGIDVRPTIHHQLADLEKTPLGHFAINFLLGFYSAPLGIISAATNPVRTIDSLWGFINDPRNSPLAQSLREANKLTPENFAQGLGGIAFFAGAGHVAGKVLSSLCEGRPQVAPGRKYTPNPNLEKIGEGHAPPATMPKREMPPLSSDGTVGGKYGDPIRPGTAPAAPEPPKVGPPKPQPPHGPSTPPEPIGTNPPATGVPPRSVSRVGSGKPTKLDGSKIEFPSEWSEVPIVNLEVIHEVPRATKPPLHIEDIAGKIAKHGFNVDEALPVFRMPDGSYRVADGHHRLQAMKNLRETTVPAKLRDWSTIPKEQQQWYRDRFPNISWP